MVEFGLFCTCQLSYTEPPRVESVCHIEGYFVGGVPFITPKAKSCAETELCSTGIVVINIPILVFCFGCLKHLVVSQPFGGGALVTVHPGSLVMGDFLKLIAKLGKFIRQ